MILSFPSPCLEGTGQFQFCHMSAPTERPTGAYGPNLLLHLLITQGFGVQGGFSSYSPSLLTGGASCALTSSCQDLKVRRIALCMLYQSDKFSGFIKESLTLYLLNSFFRRFSGHSLRLALFVYRLIVATLIGNFFDVPFLY